MIAKWEIHGLLEIWWYWFAVIIAVNSSACWIVGLLASQGRCVLSYMSCSSLRTPCRTMTSGRVRELEISFEVEHRSWSKDWWASLMTFLLSLNLSVIIKVGRNFVFMFKTGLRGCLKSDDGSNDFSNVLVQLMIYGSIGQLLWFFSYRINSRWIKSNAWKELRSVGWSYPLLTSGTRSHLLKYT